MSKRIMFWQNDFSKIGQARFWRFWGLYRFWQTRFLQSYQVIFWLALVGYIALFSGCATDIKSLEKFAHTYYYQDAKQASEFALKKSDDKDLLWLTQAGVSAFSASDDSALDLLERSENLFSKYEGEGLLARGGAQVGATMVNDNAMAYKGNIYEGVFLNYYKALAQMEAGEANATRVELNRANDRQRRAKDYYAKQINEAMNEENERYAKSSARGVVDRDSSQRQASRQLESKYSNLRQFRAFDGFINPAVSYVSGLYFSLIGDSKGIDYLKESYGITNLNSIANDLNYLTSPHFKASTQSSRDFIASLWNSGDRKNHQSNEDNENTGEDSQNQMPTNELEKLESSEFYTWIVLEEGRQAHKSEFKISLPIVTAEGIYHFGVALPQLENGISFASQYTLESTQLDLTKKSSEFFELADTDKIIATEFEKRLNAIITRAFVSSSLKVATQLGLSTGLGQVNSGLGLLGSIFGSAYSALSTNADLRITSVLPKRILLAKIKNIPQNTTQNPLKTQNTNQSKQEAKEIKEQAKRAAKGDFGYAIYADKSKISSIDFTLQSCYKITSTPKSQAQNQETKKVKKEKKRSKNISLCPYTHNIIYLRHTKAKTYHKILFSR